MFGVKIRSKNTGDNFLLPKKSKLVIKKRIFSDKLVKKVLSILRNSLSKIYRLFCPVMY
jgi:hypothetical protein